MMNDYIRNDPIEDDPAYAEILKVAEKEAEAELPDYSQG